MRLCDFSWHSSKGRILLILSRPGVASAVPQVSHPFQMENESEASLGLGDFSWDIKLPETGSAYSLTQDPVLSWEW